MRSARCLSSDRCSYLWSPIFPSRPELTAVTLSRGAQRHSYAHAPDRASKCLGSLSAIARILAAVTLLLFTMTQCAMTLNVRHLLVMLIFLDATPLDVIWWLVLFNPTSTLANIL